MIIASKGITRIRQTQAGRREEVWWPETVRAHPSDKPKTRKMGAPSSSIGLRRIDHKKNQSKYNESPGEAA